MYGQFVHWRQTLNQDAEDQDNRDEGRAPRQDNEQQLEVEEQQEEAEFASRIEEWRKQRAQRQNRDYQHHGQRHRRPREKSRQPSSSPQPTDSPSPDPTSGNTSPPGRSTVDRLARKLSKQNFQHNNRVYAQSSGQLAPSPLQSMPPVVPEAPVIVPETSTVRHAFPEYLEVDQQYQQPASPQASHSYDAPQPLTMLLGVASKRPEDKRPEFKKLRRLASARALEARLQAMIDNETQCNVRSEPPPLPPPATTTTARPWLAPTPVGEPAFIEVDPDCAMPNWDTALEVDENDTGDMSVVEDLTTSARHAHAFGGVRKHSMGGVTLRYRLSVDAALRCQNVVKTRPRMRKRDKSWHGSTVSSAMTSAVASPVIAPSISSSSTMPPPPLP